MLNTTYNNERTFSNYSFKMVAAKYLVNSFLRDKVALIWMQIVSAINLVNRHM